MNGRTRKTVIAVSAVLLLFGPALAFVVGVRGRPIENRAPVALSTVGANWRSFTRLGLYLNDRMPLRGRAIQTDAWIDRNVYNEDAAFGGGATPRVITGKNGFLFLADAIDNACAPHGTPEETVANLARFANIVAKSGRRIVTMVAPDKSSVHRDLMPADLPKQDCFDQYTEALWNGLNAADIPGFVDLRAALIKRATGTREPLYLRKDSHWDSAGSLVAIEQMLNRFAPGLWTDNEVSYQGLGEYTGDLTGLQGHPQVDQAPLYWIVRKDVTNISNEAIDDIEGGFNRRYINDAPDGRLVKGHTVMFLDSYGLVALPQLVPFFEDLTVVRLVDYAPDRFVDLIESADNIWFMSVERSLGWRLTQEVGSAAFLDQLEANLKPL
jgi:hypothetical protein